MLWKKAVWLSLAGFVSGALIGAGFMLSAWPGWREALPHMLLGGIYGAVAMAGSLVYEIEKWSIARATATHFLITFALYFVLVKAMGWFRSNEGTFWVVVAVMAAAYVLIWLLQYRSYRRKVRAMNQELEKWKSGEQENNPEENNPEKSGENPERNSDAGATGAGGCVSTGEVSED